MSTDRDTCSACASPTRPGDRFCKGCGAAVVPPTACPACSVEVPKDARFCPACGIRVIGARPTSTTTTPPADAPPAPIAAREIVDDLRRKAPSRVSGFVANVLLFVGVLLVFLVFTRQWNQGKPKEGSMFGGGEPAALPASQLASPPPGESAPAAAMGDAVRGTIALAPGTSPEGVVFAFLRPAGSPERGPPLAVRRMEPSFPLTFSIGPGEMMIPGSAFVGPFDLYVRLDRDGNAMTRDPADVTAGPVSGLMPGGPAVQVALGGQAVAPGAPAVPAAPSGSGPIEGTVKLGSTIGAAAGAALYVIVRPAGSPDRGPPVAVRKYDHPSFPLAYSVGPDDMMMEGSSFTGPFDVWARLDGDGDAASRQPGDIEMSQPAARVASGARAVELVLDKRR